MFKIRAAKLKNFMLIKLKLNKKIQILNFKPLFIYDKCSKNF